MRVSERFTKNKYLLKIWVGDPKDQKEVFNESVQEVSTRGMGMQIPRCMVPEVSVPDSEGATRANCTRDHQAVVRMEEGGDPGRQCPDRPYPSGTERTA
jgi:hypothetical protein